MSRRHLWTTVGIVLGTMVAVCGVYLTQLPAGDQSTKNSAPDKNASVTISQRQLKKLIECVSSLEARVKSLEKERGVRLLSTEPAGKMQPPVFMQPTWPSDGFGPVQTIPAG
jgi:hypothetical protein